MIVGWFDEFDRPFVECSVSIPRLRVRGTVEFLFDTGAETTSLHERDADGMGIPFEQLGLRTWSGGVGGISSYFLEPAFLLFNDGDQARIYDIDLRIAEPNQGNRLLPSLLGRDVINRWAVQYDATSRRLSCLALTADHTISF